jgi:hypothetical protein
LITDEGVPQVCDSIIALGFEELDNETVGETYIQGRYTSPEILDSAGPYPPTLEVDIYALGCVGLKVSITYLRLAEVIINLPISLYLIWFHMRLDLTTGRTKSFEILEIESHLRLFHK